MPYSTFPKSHIVSQKLGSTAKTRSSYTCFLKDYNSGNQRIHGKVSGEAATGTSSLLLPILDYILGNTWKSIYL
jgi:hypothetical protein